MILDHWDQISIGFGSLMIINYCGDPIWVTKHHISHFLNLLLLGAISIFLRMTIFYSIFSCITIYPSQHFILATLILCTFLIGQHFVLRFTISISDLILVTSWYNIGMPTCPVQGLVWYTDTRCTPYAMYRFGIDIV